jgi:cell division protein FtsW
MRKVLRNIDKPLLLVTALLFSIGLIMIFSASNVTAFMTKAESPYFYFIKQAFFLITGIIFITIPILRCPTKAYPQLSKILMFIFIGLLVYVLAFSESINQAKSWIDLGFFSLQPSEFIKVISIVWFSCYYDMISKMKKPKNKDEKNLKKIIALWTPIGMTFIVAILIFFQPDLGTTIIFLGIFALIFFAAPQDKSFKTKMFFIAIGVLLLGVVLFKSGIEFVNERQLERFDYFRPCDKLLDTGSQVCNGYIAINNGGLTGVGLGNSTQKYLYLPEPYTDFIFAIIVEELGLVVGIGIILLFMFVLYRILLIGRRSYTARGALICYGIAAYIFIHIAVNLTGMFGLFILTGVPLPFMSYGGSYTWSLIAALAIVQRINVETKLEERGELQNANN